MKPGRRILLMLLACGVVAGVVAVLWPGEREPVCRGYRLSWWIELYARDPERRDEAQRAIREIGTNGLPTLLRWISYDEPSWRTKLVDRLDKRGQRPAKLQRLAMGGAGWRARAAMWGFEALGTAAQPALLELAGLLGARSQFVSGNAMYALVNIPGQKALILAEGLTNRDSAVRLRAAECIGLLGSLGWESDEMHPAPAVPLLVGALEDPDIGVRRAATNALRSIAPRALEKPGRDPSFEF